MIWGGAAVIMLVGLVGVWINSTVVTGIAPAVAAVWFLLTAPEIAKDSQTEGGER